MYIYCNKISKVVAFDCELEMLIYKVIFAEKCLTSICLLEVDTKMIVQFTKNEHAKLSNLS